MYTLFCNHIYIYIYICMYMLVHTCIHICTGAHMTLHQNIAFWSKFFLLVLVGLPVHPSILCWSKFFLLVLVGLPVHPNIAFWSKCLLGGFDWLPCTPKHCILGQVLLCAVFGRPLLTRRIWIWPQEPRFNFEVWFPCIQKHSRGPPTKRAIGEHT